MFPVTEKLKAYGFRKKGNVLYYSVKFMNEDLEAVIEVDAAGRVRGKVIDLDLGEEYLPLSIESYTGSFVGDVRKAYVEILEEISDKCFSEKPFRSMQMNRVSEAIYERYHETFDHPFKTSPDASVFRYPENRKWYALVMNIKRNFIEKDSDDEMIEVMNLKAVPERMDELLKIDGIYPGYHMNRANWISIVLDGRVDDETVLELIDESRSFAVGKGAKRDAKGIKNWIIPANPKFFDIDEAFKNSDIITWKQSSSVRKGDIVYMYVANPVGAIRYRCEVVESDIPYSFEDSNLTIKKVMRIRLLDEYDSKLFTFKKLKEYGIRAVRGPRYAPNTLTADLENKIKK